MGDPVSERRSSRPVWLGEDQRRWDHVRVHLQVLRDPRLDAYALAVYLGLAAHAEVATGSARPSIETLAGYGGMSARKAAAVVGELVAAGYVTVEHRAGKASRYALLPPPPLHEVQGSDDPDVGISCASPLHLVPDTPAPGADELEPVNQNQRPEEPLSRVDELIGAGFDRFWSVWPDKRARKAALKAWPAAVKAAGSIGVIVEGAERYRDDPNRDPAFTAHASSWLNSERWSDPPLARRGSRPAAPAQRVIEDRSGRSGRIDL